MVKLVYDKGGCVGCPTEMGCLGSGCPYCWEVVITCDICRQEGDEVWRDGNGVDVCEECRNSYYQHITVDNASDYINERGDNNEY